MVSPSKIASSAAAAAANGQPSQPLSSSSSSLRDRARRALRSFVRDEFAPSHGEKEDQSFGEEEQDVLDACRVLRHEAHLLYHTERVREAILQDPLKVLFAHEPLNEDDDDESKKNSTRNITKEEAAFTASRRRRQLLEPVFRTVEVVEFDQAVTRDGYVRIEATLRLFAAHKSSTHPPKRKKGRSASKDDPSTACPTHSSDGRFVELRFCYERTAIMTDSALRSPVGDPSPTYVSYQIDYCGSSGSSSSSSSISAAPIGPRQRLLWVNVVAPMGTPSPHGAQMYDEDGDDSALWSDVESDDEKGDTRGATGKSTSPDKKRRKKCMPDCRCDGEVKFLPKASNPHDKTAEKDPKADDEDENDDDDGPLVNAKDVFAGGVDPDVLQELLAELRVDDPVLTDDDSAAIFLLMTFPFYEHEWDMVGYVLDSAFGPDGDDDSDDHDEEDERDEE
jgi:hypothetical protein